MNNFNLSLNEKLTKYIEDYNKYLAYYANFVILPKDKIEALISNLDRKCEILADKYNIEYN